MTPEAPDTAPGVVVTMIVKNEAEALPLLFASVSGLADAFVIVDTGSTDDTPRVARILGELHQIPVHVIADAWDDDFARSRNVGLDAIDKLWPPGAEEPATDPWVLWLDGDDRIEHAEALRATLNEVPLDGVKIVMLSVYSPKLDGCVEVVNQIRAWRQSTRIRFQYPAHMQPDLRPVPRQEREAGTILDARIVHTGYADGRGNAERTLRIVRAKMPANHPHRLNCEVRALATLGRAGEAGALALDALEEVDNGYALGDGTLWKIAADYTIQARNDIPGAVLLMAEGLNYFPDDPDGWFNLYRVALAGAIDSAAAFVEGGYPTVSIALPQILAEARNAEARGTFPPGAVNPARIAAIGHAVEAPADPHAPTPATFAETPHNPEADPPAPHALRAVIAERGSKPSVLILTDVKNWAWARKAEHLERCLADTFNIEVWPVVDQGDPPKGFDLYHTFEFPQVDRLVHLGSVLFVTGITAHVWQTWSDGRLRRWARDAAAIHANSILLRDEMASIFGKPHDATGTFDRERPIYYVPNGVDPGQFRRTRPRRESDRLVVGHVGKPNPRKGGRFLEDVCRQAGVKFQMIQRTSKDALNAEEILDWYQDLDVIAVASTMDGTPNPALEAACCEAAVLSNRIGNMPEFIVNGLNGFLLPEIEPAAYIEALTWMAQHRDVTRAMGEEARRTAEAAWTWETQSEHYATMWLDVLQRGGVL